MGQPPSILSISSYQSLLQTREWILKGAGFHVVSTPDVNQALAQCRTGHFDVVIIGHGIPSKSRAVLMTELRRQRGTRVISLFSLGEPPAPEADYSLHSLEGPEKLIAVVKAAVKKSQRPADPEVKKRNDHENSAA